MADPFHPIFTSLASVLERPKYVRIDDEALERALLELPPLDAGSSGLEADDIPERLTQDERLGFVMVLDALNFCFWGEPKWTMMKDGVALGGSTGLAYALKSAVESRRLILEPQALCALTHQNLRTIFAANTEIPLLDERLSLLHSLGESMQQTHVQAWQDVVGSMGGDALNIAERLVEIFPQVFGDEAVYLGEKVRFWKRVQLAAYHLISVAEAGLVSLFRVSRDCTRLTGLADYKIPQVLRERGILVYEEELSKKINRKELLPAGSQEELEIRASMVETVRRATNLLQKQQPSLTNIQVSNIFWSLGRTNVPIHPHHRTKTIWY